MAKKLSASAQPAGRVTVTSEDIRQRTWTEREKQALRSGINSSVIPPLTDAQLSNMVQRRAVRRKVVGCVRLGPKVLDWLKSKSEGHVTRINDILTNLMEAEHRHRRRSQSRRSRVHPGASL